MSRDLDTLLLHRQGLVVVPTRPGGEPDRRSRDGLTVLESDLALLGYRLTAPLYAALARQSPVALRQTGTELLSRIDLLLGNERRHRPLFHGFPDQVPADAHLLYSARVLAFLRNQPHLGCSWCEDGPVVELSGPCGHLLCQDCQDVAEPFAGCPLCGTVPTGEDPPPPSREIPADAVLRPLRLAVEPAAAAQVELGRLLARQTPLAPQDREDLAVLLDNAPADPGGWLPATIPVRETKATVLAELLHRDLPGTLPALGARLDTATDVLRLLWAWSGAEPDLLADKPPRLLAVPRPLRRTLLAALDALPPAGAAEDMLRHRAAWQRAGEVLHPYEHHRRYPNAAAAFAVARGTDLLQHPLGDHLLAAPLPVAGTAGGRNRLTVTTFAARVEAALATGDVPGAVALLAHRPGELARRLHHLLRTHHRWAPDAPCPPALLAVLPDALRRVAPGPLLGAYGRLRAPRPDNERRLYFPRGHTAHTHARTDWGSALPARIGAPVCELIEAELLRRAADRPRYDLALLDEELTGLTVPSAERASARSLVAVPRGSVLPLPDGARLRLFLYWLQPKGVRVDLDLSVAFYDKDWALTGLCDYTKLVHGARTAVHSGDFTSAPNGATEFVDLDLAGLAAAGARYAVVVVFSYNDIPFDELPDAYTGFMTLGAPGRSAGPLDPKAVTQRLDLAGAARVALPMIVDLAERHWTWTDLNLGGTGGLHDVRRHSGRLGTLASDVLHHFTPGARATLGDLALAAAAAGTDQVLIRSGGTVATYHRAPDESVGAFAARIRDRQQPDRTAPFDPGVLTGRHAFLALLNGDLPAAPTPTGTLYRLYPGALDATPGLDRLTAGDLVARFAPEA
ncbi:MXAN_6230/SCO0854 family RING domain-containing protein [Kitasatospora sp. NPDC101801]|uniref:MXAN_6230/SCO0854 family RING domain-containing protein n=1 Tax=Kitasatospora sp. NPDC101801 TaxID=3364103 RepID=UPI0038297389